MAVKFGSAARSPVLGLLLRAALAALGAYLFRESGSFVTLLAFFLIFWLIYFYSSFNNRKFLASALVLFALPVLLPPGGKFIIILWGVALFLLLGVKNLILLKRQGSYEALHLLIIFGIGLLYLLNFLPLVPQIFLFIIFFFLFREFYFTLAPFYPQRLTLTAALLSFVLVEIAWSLTFLPVNFLTAAAFLGLIAFLFHDLTLHHFQGTLSRQLVLRNATLFIVLSIVLFLLPG